MTEANKVLVIGGGIAGLTAAWELAHLGLEVLLVEKGPFLGGHAAYFACKATDRCLKCNNCLVEQRLKEVRGHPGIRPFLQTRLTGISRTDEGFQVTLAQTPLVIDPERCTDCGRCYEVCPGREQGAIQPGPSIQNHPFYVIRPEHCSCEPESRLCQKICPEGAIELARPGQELTAAVAGVVVATGYTPFDPREKPLFNFANNPNMITGLELERRLREEGLLRRPLDGQPAASVAFVQCAGSRDKRLGHNFCSRVCCGYALRLGLRLGHLQPEVNITVFYMDIQNFGKDFVRVFREANGRLRLVRAMPGDYLTQEDGRISLRFFDPESQTARQEAFDVVVLSVGIMPNLDNQELFRMLGVELNEFGFALNRPERHPKVVVAGTAEGPMDIAEAITHGARAAAQLARQLGVLP